MQSINEFTQEHGFNSSSNPIAIIRTACQHGRLDVIQDVIQRGVDGSIVDLFDTACKFGQLNIAKYLHTMVGNAVVDYNWILRSVCNKDHDFVNVVEYLVEELGANVLSNNSYSLRMASARGNVKTVEYLISKGAGVHALCNEAIKLAAQNDHLEVVKLLHSNGAKLDGVCQYTGHRSVMEYLISKGADKALVSACYSNDPSAKEVLLENGANLAGSNYCPSSQLLLACKAGIVDDVERLLRHHLVKIYYDGCKHIVGRSGYIENIRFLNYAAENGRLEIVKLLLERYDNMFGSKWRIALEKARKRGHTSVVDFLELRYGNKLE